MNEQTKHSDQTPQIRPAGQHEADASQALADDVTRKDDAETSPDPYAEHMQKSLLDQPALPDLGDPTTPMPIQPATTIQVATRPDETASPSDQDKQSQATMPDPSASSDAHEAPPPLQTETDEKAFPSTTPTPILTPSGSTPIAAQSQQASPITDAVDNR